MIKVRWEHLATVPVIFFEYLCIYSEIITQVVVNGFFFIYSIGNMINAIKIIFFRIRKYCRFCDKNKYKDCFKIEYHATFKHYY